MPCDGQDVEARVRSPRWSYIEDFIVAYRKKRSQQPLNAETSASSDGPTDMDGEPCYTRRRPWYGLQSDLAPRESTRDFCMRERNFLSWAKFFMMVTVLSATMFLDLQIQDPQYHSDSFVGWLEETSIEAPVFPHRPPGQEVFALPSPPSLKSISASSLPSNHHSSKVSLPAENLILGTVYFVVAILSWIISTYDYFKCVRELEAEHTYLDECEGHSHPVVTLLSIFICLIVFFTVILLLVQHTT